MKVVIFGATGNIGRRVANEALHRPNPRGLPAPSLSANARALIAGLRSAGVKRVLYVGGASSLEVAPEDARRPAGLPRDVQGGGQRGARGAGRLAERGQGTRLDLLESRRGDRPGERTGTYRTTGDQLLVDASGKSFITFEDAVAVLDELEHPRHIGRRFGVAY